MNQSFYLLIFLCLSICFILRTIFSVFKLPPFVIEIFAGILLGSTLLASLSCNWNDQLMQSQNQLLIHALKDVGLIFLMFYSGAEIQIVPNRSMMQKCLWGVIMGITIPALICLGSFFIWQNYSWMGIRGDAVTLKTILILSMSVTSIPVISRIFLDLKMLRTPFAQFVLTIALLEDFILYAVLNGTLNHHVSNMPNMVTSVFFNIAVSCIFMFIVLTCKKPIYNFLRKFISNFSIHEDHFYIIYLYFLLTGIIWGMSLLNIQPMLSAFACGLIFGVGNSERSLRLHDKIKDIAMTTFIPFYFIAAGLKIHLNQNFSLWVLIIFFIVSSCGKLLAGFIIGKIIQKPSKAAWLLGFTLNARGGPGIVIATMALEGKFISTDLYSILVLTAIITSWLTSYMLNKNKQYLEQSFEATV